MPEVDGDKVLGISGSSIRRSVTKALGGRI